MKIEVAKTSGFCFGVNRVVSITDRLLSENKKVCTLGPIIHNPDVIENFKNRKAVIINSPKDYISDSVLIIRSHGIIKTEFDYIINHKLNYIDTTCPFVKKIHNIVSKYSKDKKNLLLAGDINHPEVIGIKSYFSGKSFVFKNLEDLEKIIKNNDFLKNESILVVSQTTFSRYEWEKCIKFINNVLTNTLVFDTICNTTSLRQNEAENLSKKSDLMIVIGGKQSSNTHKLYDICSKNTHTLWIERVDDLKKTDLKKYEYIGIIAGASTPNEEVSRVYSYLSSE